MKTNKQKNPLNTYSQIGWRYKIQNAQLNEFANKLILQIEILINFEILFGFTYICSYYICISLLTPN